MYTGAWVPNMPGEMKKEFHVGPHIMVVTPRRDKLQGFSRDGWNGTYVTHLPGDNHTDLLFLVRFCIVSPSGCFLSSPRLRSNLVEPVP